MCKVIKRRTPVELMDAIYKAEDWKRAEGESRTRRCNELYAITADPRTGFYVATRRECADKARLDWEKPGVVAFWLVTLDGLQDYAVRTYPDTDMLYVETAARRRKLTDAQTQRLAPRFRAAIARFEPWRGTNEYA